MSRNCFVILYKSLVRSHLEYANSVGIQKENLMWINYSEYRKEQQS